MNRLSRPTALFALGLAAAVAALRAAPGANASLSVTTDCNYATSYVFRGLRLAQHSWQPAVTVERGGFSGGVWANVPLDPAGAHEIDPFAFYAFEHSGLSWETGLQVYTYPEARGEETTHSWELSLGVTAPLGLLTGVPVNAGITIDYDPRLDSQSAEARLEHGTEIRLAGRSAELDSRVFAGTVSSRNLAPDAPGSAWRDAYFYYGAGLSVSVKLAAGTALTLAVQWDDARNVDPGQGATGNLSAQIGLGRRW